MNEKNHEIDEELSNILQVIMDADYLGKGNLDEEIKYLEIYGKLSAGISPYSFHVYDKLASIYLNEEYNPIKAAEYFEKSLLIHQQHKGADSVEVVDCYLKIGDAYSRVGIGEKTVENYKSALDIIKVSYCSVSELVADLYKKIASAYWIYIEDYPMALAYLTLSLETYYAQEDDEMYTEKIAGIFNTMGLLHGYLLNYNVSIECYKNSIQLLTKAFGVGDYELITNYEALALMLIETNDYEEALDYLEQFLAIKDKVCPSWSKAGSILNKIAIVYENQFDYLVALNCYQKALQEFETLEQNRSVAEDITGVTESIRRVAHLLGG